MSSKCLLVVHVTSDSRSLCADRGEEDAGGAAPAADAAPAAEEGVSTEGVAHISTAVPLLTSLLLLLLLLLLLPSTAPSMRARLGGAAGAALLLLQLLLAAAASAEDDALLPTRSPDWRRGSFGRRFCFRGWFCDASEPPPPLPLPCRPPDEDDDDPPNDEGLGTAAAIGTGVIENCGLLDHVERASTSSVGPDAGLGMWILYFAFIAASFCIAFIVAASFATSCCNKFFSWFYKIIY